MSLTPDNPEMIPGSPAAEGREEPGEFTRIFGSRTPQVFVPEPEKPAAPPEPVAPAPAMRPAPVVPATPRPVEAEREPEGFTQIFSPLARPSAPPPAVAAAPAAAEPGEFTQFFSALSSRSAPAPEPAAPVPVSSTPAASPVPPAQPGTFTQLAQQILTPAPATPTPAQTPAPSAPVPAPAAREENFPSIFSQPAQSSAPPPPAAPFAVPRAPAAAQSQEHGFTEMFRAVSNPAPVRTPPPPPAPSFAPAPPPNSAPAPLAGGAGEFTRLMQNLEGQSQSQGQNPPQGYAPAPAASAPAFHDAPLYAPAGGSEFTRVLRGDAMRESGAIPAAPAAVPAVNNGKPLAPGLAIAPMAAVEKATGGVKKKQSQMMLILGLVNAVLLLGLLAIGLLVMRHHH